MSSQPAVRLAAREGRACGGAVRITLPPRPIGDWLQLNQFIADDRLIHWRSVGVFLDKYDPRMELLIEPYELKPGEI